LARLLSNEAGNRPLAEKPSMMEGATEVVFWVIVAIKDKVFNPFLTTKPAGGRD
jgi:hypothetical protein